jgi:hypothetical protein
MLDRIGTVLAGLCAVHCALLPLAVATTSSFTLALLSWHDPHHDLAMWLMRISRWEAWVVLGAITFATISIGIGFRVHRNTRPALMVLAASLSFGLALYAPVFRTPLLHAVLAVMGGVLLVTAHLVNLGALRSRRREM